MSKIAIISQKYKASFSHEVLYFKIRIYNISLATKIHQKSIFGGKLAY